MIQTNYTVRFFKKLVILDMIKKNKKKQKTELLVNPPWRNKRKVPLQEHKIYKSENDQMLEELSTYLLTFFNNPW